MLFQANRTPIRAELISFVDAVELEIHTGACLRRRLRFVRDAGARRRADLLRARLSVRGFGDRRTGERVSVWPGGSPDARSFKRQVPILRADRNLRF